MINAVSCTNSLGETLRMDLFHPWETGIAIKNITGLGTPVYNISSTPYGYGDGSTVGNVSAENRNIVFEFWPLPNPLVEDSRQLLYRFFQVKKPIVLTFELDNRTVMIEGYVEHNTPEIFSERETIQISVICPDPNFHEAFKTSSFIFGREPMFEFPFENKSVTEPLLVMGNINLENRAQIDYYAEADTGVVIEIEVRADPGNITIYDLDTLEHIILYKDRVFQITGSELIPKDIVYISTLSGQRYVKLLREGVEYNLLGAVNKDISWFTLEQGPNQYTYQTSYEDASIVISFKYRKTYASI